MPSGPSPRRGALAVALGLILGASLLAGVDDGRSAQNTRHDAGAIACSAPDAAARLRACR